MVFGAPSGCGEAGSGGRVRLPHREGAAGRPELRSRPEPRASIYLRGPGLEGLLLVHGARRWPSWGEWAHVGEGVGGSCRGRCGHKM